MKTIKSNVEKMIEVKNSKFICILIRLNDNNIENYIEDIKEKYPKATHYCYGYIYDNDKKSSDDGEPSGTAGMPILNVLEKENLNYVLAVTVRYFGGIKLGAGGLVRAYTKSITEALKEIQYVDLIPGYRVQIKFPYNEEKQINYILKDVKILNRDYQEDISYQILISNDSISLLHNYHYQILENLYIEKKDS